MDQDHQPRRPFPAAIYGGAGWLLLAVLYMLQHGPGFTDYRRTLLGLTWMDTNKLATPILVLLLMGMVQLRQRIKGPLNRPAMTGYQVGVAGFGLLAISQALKYWLIPFGTYELSAWHAQFYNLAASLEFIGIYMVAVGSALLALDVLKTRALPRWNGLPFLTSLALVFSPFLYNTPLIGWLYGALWLALGLVMRTPGEAQPGGSQP